MATSTPWGVSQSVTQIARGIRRVSTAGHGGVLLSPTKNALIPEYMRDDSGAYEEDCEWCIPAVVFESEWRAWADSTKWTTGDFQMECAWSTFKDGYPEAYEKFTGKTLEVGESYRKDERALNVQVKESFIACSAWGDSKEDIPKGMVGVLARRSTDGNKIFCLVPKDEYKSKTNVSVGKAAVFVVDPTCHKQIEMPEYAK